MITIVKKILFPLLFFFVISVVITYPLLFNINTKASGYGDELIIAWIASSNIHNITTNPLKLFETNSFYPLTDTLAYSETFFTSSLLFALPQRFFGQPIAFHNLNLIASLLFLGFAVYFLTFFITKNWLISLLSGILVVFSPVTLDKYIHLQVLFIFFVPLSIYFYFKYIEEEKFRFFSLAIFCFVLQSLNSFLPGYFIFFSLLSITLVTILQRKRTLQYFFNIRTLAVSLLAFLVLVPFILPYYQVSKEFGYTRDIRDSIHFANQPEDFLYTSEFSRLAPFFNSFWHRQSYPASVSFKNGFPGTVFLLLIIFSMYYLIRNWKTIDYKIKSLFLSGMIGLILSLGPFLHINRQTIHHPIPIPLPYLPLYYLAPGFNGMRNSARWEVLYIICMAVVVGYILAQVAKKYGKSQIILLVVLLVCFIFLEYQPSINFVQIPQKSEFPKEYSYVAAIPNAKVIEMPIYNWNTFPYAGKEYLRQYFSIIDFIPRVNGVSGFSPPPWQTLVVSLLKTFPSPESIKQLKELGVNTIIVHPQDYNEMAHDGFKVDGKQIPDAKHVIETLDRSPQLKKVQSYSTGVIYYIK